jgi:hypothetical protein
MSFDTMPNSRSVGSTTNQLDYEDSENDTQKVILLPHYFDLC